MICTNSVHFGKSPRSMRRQVALVRFAVVADDRLGLGVGQVADALLRLEVELDPVALVRALMKLKVCEPKPCMWR
jgi:hypothetical protein